MADKIRIKPICVMGFFVSVFFQHFSINALSGQNPYVLILGIAQDAGYPQIHCQQECCRKIWNKPSKHCRPVSLGLVDANENKSWLVEATPAIKYQWQLLKDISRAELSGILLTHAHAGHYTGILELGKEMMSAGSLPLFVLPRMAHFLRSNEPWRSLIYQQNVDIKELTVGSDLNLTSALAVEPILVPHRDELSETAGFIVKGPQKKLLFIPDIDKWNRWETDIRVWIKMVDFALIDGTFYQDGEIKHRNMDEIPHPFIVESIELFRDLEISDRAKIFFIHLNHTNPLLTGDKKATKHLSENDLQVAKEGMIFKL